MELNQTQKTMIGIAADHAGYELKGLLIEYLREQGYEVKDFGTHSTESMDYPDVAHPLAASIEEGTCEWGIAICGTGNGISMTVNKHAVIRAALCWTPEIAALARQHNNANILSLPARFVSNEEALAMLKTFIETPFEGGRHQRRIDKIACL